MDQAGKKTNQPSTSEKEEASPPNIWDLLDAGGEFRDDAALSIFGTLQVLSENASETLQTFGTGDTRDDIARYGLCLVIEAAELVNALPWKRWARHPADMSKAVEEFADLLCFVGSIVGLFGRLGFNEAQLTEAYLKKIQENKDRFSKYQFDLQAADLISPQESPKDVEPLREAVDYTTTQLERVIQFAPGVDIQTIQSSLQELVNTLRIRQSEAT